MHPRSIVTEGRVELGGRMVPYSSIGTGRPVVLLPDHDDRPGAWQDVIDSLTGTHRLISVGLPGRGDGVGSSDQDASGGHAALLRGLLRTLGLPPVRLVGHGGGVDVALRFAEYYPEATSRLVLIGADDVDAAPVAQPGRGVARISQRWREAFAPPDAGPGHDGAPDPQDASRRPVPSDIEVLRLDAEPVGAEPGAPGEDVALLSASSLSALRRFLDS